MRKTVLVTGGTGFVGIHCIVALLRQGYDVRTTVRRIEKKTDVMTTLRNTGFKLGEQLSFFEADLLFDNGWRESMNGCDYVLHVASPFPSSYPKDENEVIRPAKEGTLRVLSFAKEAEVKRVVVTSSTAAINYGHPTRAHPFTEEDWTNLESPIVPPYPRSKTIAERAAWDYIRTDGGSLELAVVNPTGIFGPVLNKELSASVMIIKMLLDGAPAFPKLKFNVVDVRDLADLQIRAMENPAAKGQRFIAASDGYLSIQEVSQLLRSRLGERGKKAKPRSIPDWVVRILALFVRDLRNVTPVLGEVKDCSNEKARQTLGWSPRPKEEVILATAESLIAISGVK